VIGHFYYHPRMLQYDFGPQHPLRPERLKRAIQLLESVVPIASIDPGLGRREDVLRVHDEDYVEAVELLGSGYFTPEGFKDGAGFGTLDNPAFPEMHEASLSYVAGSVAAAHAVCDGAYRAFSLSGGLHHALRSKASGFCIYNDPAIALDVLLERFDRVAYIDIDVHHGDGVQWLWLDDPRVLTCSIHEDGRTLFPRTGAVEETGSWFTSLNVPIEAKTSGDVWLWAFEQTVLPAMERFQPQALVLQMGTDPHYQDRLGHLRVTAAHWLGAVRRVHELDLPTVAVGGGGYNLDTVPRMWAAAVLMLSDAELPEALPEPLASQWRVPAFLDVGELPEPGIGREHAEAVVDRVRRVVLANLAWR
jgi:acetoin utilization protein AcuC